MAIDMEIIDNSVVAHAPSPRSRLPLETLDVTPQGVVLHGEQRGFNAPLFFWGELLEVFLGGSGDFEIPHHGVIHLMIPRLHDERQPDRGGGQRVRLSSVARLDSALRNRHEELL